MRGTLINISGKTNSGKTTLAIAMAKSAILNGWMVNGNESFKTGFPYPTLDDSPLDDDHDFDVELKLAIFDDADRMGETLHPLVERLRKQGTHVVTITHGHDDQPVVSITGQPDVFLMRALFGSACIHHRHSAGHVPRIEDSVSAGDDVESPYYVIFDDFAFFPLPSKGHQASQAPRRDARKARKLGVCMVFAKSDISGLKRASPEEVENIVRNLANAQTRVHLNVDEHDEAAMRAAGSVSAGDAKSYGERVTSTIHNHRVSDTLAKRLKSAGYIPGQTYEQCCNMALWHPEMASVMETINNKGLFYLVTKCMPQPGLHHEVVLGKTGIGKKDVLLSFADDLHEVFSKHEMLVAAGRAEGIQLAVSRELLDMLSQHVGADGYLGNLHVI